MAAAADAHALGTPRAGDDIVHGGALRRKVQRQRRKLRGRAALHEQHLRAMSQLPPELTHTRCGGECNSASSQTSAQTEDA